MAVNIGEVEGVIKLRDEFTAVFNEYSQRIAKVEKDTAALGRRTKTEFDKVRDSYNKTAASLDPVVRNTQRYEAAERSLAAALRAGIITQSQYNSQLSLARTKYLDAQAGASGLTRAVQGAGRDLVAYAGGFLAVTTALNAIIKLTKQFVTANVEAEESQQRVVAAARRSTSGVSANQISDVADELSRLSGIDDELIADAAALGLRYNRIGQEIFPRFTKAALDMSVATGKDLSSSLEKAGKIVNQPVRGLTLLAREGYAVSKSQADLVKGFIKSNDLISAQSVMLGILEGQYAGAADAARNTLGGALRALDTNFENLLEEIGKDSTGPFREGVESLNELLVFMTDHVSDLQIGFLDLRAKVNIFVSGALNGVADLVEGLSKAAPLLGIVGIGAKAVGSNVAGRLRAGARTAEQEAAKDIANLAKALTGLEVGTRKAGKSTKDLTDSETKLGNEINKVKKSVDDTIAALTRQADQTESLWLAAGRGVVAYQEEQLKQKIANELLKQEHELRKVGKELTDKQAKAIENAVRKQDEFNKKLDLTLRAQAKIGTIELRRTDVDILFGGRPTTATGPDPLNADELVAELERIEEAADDSADAFRRQREESDEFYRDFSQNVRDGQKSIRDEVNEYIGRVKEAHESGVEGALTAAEMEKELARARLEGNLAVADSWASVLSTISGLFGNFGQQVISSLQQIISTAQQLQSLGNQIGGSAGSAISAAGPYLAVAGAIYSAQRSSAQRQRQRLYTSGATMEFGGEVSETFGRQGRAIANQVSNALEDILAIIGRTLAVIPKIEIQAREDGKKFSVNVGSLFVGIFDTMQEAIDAAALRVANYLSGDTSLSDTLRTVLANTTAQTAEQLGEQLNFAQWFDSLGMGEMPARIREMMLEFTRAMELGDELGLDTNRIVDWFADSVQTLEAEMLGIDLAAAERLRNLRGFREGMRAFDQQSRQIIQNQINTTRELLETAINRSNRTGPGGGGPGIGGGEGGSGSGGGRGSGGRFDRGQGGGGITKDIDEATEEIRRLQEELARLEDQLANTTESLSDVELDMGIFDILHQYLRENRKYDEDAIKFARLKAVIEFEAIKKELILIGKWEEFAEMFTDAFNTAMEEAGKKPSRGRGGAGGGQRDNVASFIADREFQLGLASATAYRRAVAELNRTYDDQLKQAGKDQKLRTQLLALKERELALLQQEQAANVTDQFREFLGLVSPFDQVTDTATDLIKEIENSPFGNARKAAMIGRVLGQVDKQLDKLAREKTLSIFNELASDLERLGVGEAQSIEIRKAAAILEHHIKIQHYKTEVEILRASGRVAKETLALLDAAIATFEGADPNAVPKVEENTKRFKSAVSTTVDAIGDLAAATEDAARALLDIFREISDSNRDLLTDENLSALSPVARRDEAARVYEETLAKARAGDVEALRNFTGVRQTYLDIQRSLAHSGPAYAALFEKVIKEGAGLVLSPETGQAAINNLIAEQTATVAQGQALLHQDLLQLRSSVVDSLANLSSRLGQPAIINGIPRFAQFSAQSQAAGLNASSGVGGVGSGSSLANDNATPSALIDSIQSTGDATVRSLGVVSHEVTMMRNTIETLNQRLSVLENGISRVASLGESTSRASGGRNR